MVGLILKKYERFCVKCYGYNVKSWGCYVKCYVYYVKCWEYYKQFYWYYVKFWGYYETFYGYNVKFEDITKMLRILCKML